jgi:deoxyribodipyrimidine photo-lyase
MWIAMYACNVLGYDFYNLSKWMYYHLLDGDLASNTLSWQWVAGTLTGKKYFANQENLNKYDNKNKQFKTALDTSYGDLQNKVINCEYEKSESVTMEEAGIISNNWKHESLSKVELDNYLSENINKLEKIYLHNIFTLDSEWKKGEGIHLIFIEKELLVSSPMSDKRLDFIYNLSKNIATENEEIKNKIGKPHESKVVYFYGDVEDLEVYRSRIHYKWHAFSDHIPGVMENSNHMFPDVTDPTGSMMGWWKKCEDML